MSADAGLQLLPLTDRRISREAETFLPIPRSGPRKDTPAAHAVQGQQQSQSMLFLVSCTVRPK